MNFLPTTMKVMRHFKAINESLLIKPGNQLATIKVGKSVYARATLPEQTFDNEIGIGDLNRFFGVFGLFSEPRVEVNGRQMIVSGDGRTLRYTLHPAEHLNVPPAGNPQLPSEDVRFRLQYKPLDDVLKAAGALGIPEIAFACDGDGEIYVETYNVRNPTTDVYRVKVADSDTKLKFRIAFKVENVIVLPADYDVTLSVKKRSLWRGRVLDDSVDMLYMISGEDTSRIG